MAFDGIPVDEDTNAILTDFDGIACEDCCGDPTAYSFFRLDLGGDFIFGYNPTGLGINPSDIAAALDANGGYCFIVGRNNAEDGVNMVMLNGITGAVIDTAHLDDTYTMNDGRSYSQPARAVVSGSTLYILSVGGVVGYTYPGTVLPVLYSVPFTDSGFGTPTSYTVTGLSTGVWAAPNLTNPNFGFTYAFQADLIQVGASNAVWVGDGFIFTGTLAGNVTFTEWNSRVVSMTGLMYLKTDGSLQVVGELQTDFSGIVDRYIYDRSAASRPNAFWDYDGSRYYSGIFWGGGFGPPPPWMYVGQTPEIPSYIKYDYNFDPPSTTYAIVPGLWDTYRYGFPNGDLWGVSPLAFIDRGYGNAATNLGVFLEVVYVYDPFEGTFWPDDTRRWAVLRDTTSGFIVGALPQPPHGQGIGEFIFVNDVIYGISAVGFWRYNLQGAVITEFTRWTDVLEYWVIDWRGNRLYSNPRIIKMVYTDENNTDSVFCWGGPIYVQ